MYSLKKYYPIKTNDLIRVGRNRDGGYIINARIIKTTKLLIGLGISIDWSFEKDFKQKNKNLKIFAFDYSVSVKEFLKKAWLSSIHIFNNRAFSNKKKASDKLKIFLYPFLYLKIAFQFEIFFNRNKNNLFFKNGIDNFQHDIFITPAKMFSIVLSSEHIKPDSVFLKMDIENSEYNILSALLEYTDYINSMAIEFHELKKHWSIFESIMDELMQEYAVVHIHGNNFAGYITGTQIPECIEITITKKSLLTKEELAAVNTQKYPVKGLDYPCYNKLQDIQIGFN
jgi:hypothetical protein